MHDITIQYADMPVSIPAFVKLNESDMSYTIFLNTRHTHERNIQSLHHELSHIENDDFNTDSLQSIEFDRHNLIDIAK